MFVPILCQFLVSVQGLQVVPLLQGGERENNELNTPRAQCNTHTPRKFPSCNSISYFLQRFPRFSKRRMTIFGASTMGKGANNEDGNNIAGSGDDRGHINDNGDGNGGDLRRRKGGAGPLAKNINTVPTSTYNLEVSQCFAQYVTTPLSERNPADSDYYVHAQWAEQVRETKESGADLRRLYPRTCHFPMAKKIPMAMKMVIMAVLVVSWVLLTSVNVKITGVAGAVLWAVVELTFTSYTMYPRTTWAQFFAHVLYIPIGILPFLLTKQHFTEEQLKRMESEFTVDYTIDIPTGNIGNMLNVFGNTEEGAIVPDNYPIPIQFTIPTVCDGLDLIPFPKYYYSLIQGGFDGDSQGIINVNHIYIIEKLNPVLHSFIVLPFLGWLAEIVEGYSIMFFCNGYNPAWNYSLEPASFAHGNCTRDFFKVFGLGGLLVVAGVLQPAFFLLFLIENKLPF